MTPTHRSLASLLCAILALSACRREARRFSEPPAASQLHPDPAVATYVDAPSLKRYAADAWAMSEGQRLYSQMNCAGCHGHGGGGGMGPPLMDSAWIYGSDMQDIERTVLAGTARGMPAFRDKLSRQQVWQLAAYVRALSGSAPSSAAPVRDDHLSVRPPPSRTEPEPPFRQKID
ncbi:MAG TPA: c-type cytochrome [Polyangiaceae bacterium]|nr:c-type cytochrome [Polyangiaceae bacterium]